MKISRTHCAQMPETESKVLNPGNKSTSPPQVQAAQDLHRAAQITPVKHPVLKPYLHPRRSCRPTGVHSLNVAGLAPPHHKAPAHCVTNDLGREKKDVTTFKQLHEIQGANIETDRDITSTSLYLQHIAKDVVYRLLYRSWERLYLNDSSCF